MITYILCLCKSYSHYFKRQKEGNLEKLKDLPVITKLVIGKLKFSHMNSDSKYSSLSVASTTKKNHFTMLFNLFCCCSFAKPCPNLSETMNCSTPGSLFFTYLPNFAQIHMHFIQPMKAYICTYICCCC